MHIIEILLIVVATSIIFFNKPLKSFFGKDYILAFLGFLIIVQLLWQGYRWQMIPAYALLVLAVISLLRNAQKKSIFLIRMVRAIGILLILGLAILLPTVLPVFQFPRTSGSYSVGTTDIQLNLERPETITQDQDDTRNLMIKTWYPSNEVGNKMDSYVDHGGRHGFAKKYGLPPSMLNYLDHVKTTVYRDVAIANERFPVLVFSHGYNSKANGYNALLSELASHGYIIFALNHTYESTGTTFADGSEVYFDQDYARRIDSGTFHIIAPSVDAINEGVPFSERHTIVAKGLTDYYVGEMQERWADDMVDVINELEFWNRKGLFKGTLDISKLGVFGHSRGGGAAGLTMLYDDRVQVAANVDGVQWGDVVDTTFAKPFLLLSSDWPPEHPNFNEHAYINKSESYFYDATLRQSAHSNFMDIPFMIPMRAISTAGSIDPNVAIEASCGLLRSFFDKHLKNKEVDIKESISEFPLLELDIYHRGEAQ
ncbi:MAG: hypothetical protein ACI9FN_000307 [Saprospiraceae bacterium]|jgi:hypothetical protein